MKKILLLSLAVISLFSCATKKEILYFQDSQVLDEKTIDQAFEPIIEPNDILYITVSSMDETVIKPFQRNTGLQNSGTSGNIGLQGYLVNSEGVIQFPTIGELAVSGKTRAEVQTLLKGKLLEFIKDAVVDVRILNFKVTVIGEVTNPGVFTIQDERVTLPQAIGLAGDFTLDGRRKDVTIIREVDGKRQVARIDFTKSDFFDSPFYFLKQNDVVYVEPSLKGVKKSGFIPDVPALLSLFTIVLSSVIILSR